MYVFSCVRSRVRLTGIRLYPLRSQLINFLATDFSFTPTHYFSPFQVVDTVSYHKYRNSGVRNINSLLIQVLNWLITKERSLSVRAHKKIIKICQNY
ncbi:hypothetical protein OSCI_2680011 [Kamptonema sp. PCC 6506]|nr:hypothetical protein OSCI_2680011 [Kamptonema sp. PCC 6506]